MSRAKDLKESAEMHRNIYSAIRRRDVAAATAAMRDHLLLAEGSGKERRSGPVERATALSHTRLGMGFIITILGLTPQALYLRRFAGYEAELTRGTNGVSPVAAMPISSAVSGATPMWQPPSPEVAYVTG